MGGVWRLRAEVVRDGGGDFEEAAVGAVAADQLPVHRPSGTCFYWLHTHAADGIIHIESPVHRTYTLGNFFDEWGQPLSTSQVGPASGHVVAIYNGQVYQGNPRDIPLTAHAQIQLEVGTPLVAPEQITFPSGLLPPPSGPGDRRRAGRP